MSCTRVQSVADNTGIRLKTPVQLIYKIVFVAVLRIVRMRFKYSSMNNADWCNFPGYFFKLSHLLNVFVNCL